MGVTSIFLRASGAGRSQLTSTPLQVYSDDHHRAPVLQICSVHYQGAVLSAHPLGSALPYSALASQGEQPRLEMKPFVMNAPSPVLAVENQTCPLKCFQDSMPGVGYPRLPVASIIPFLAKKKKKKVSFGTDLESYHFGKYLAGQNVLCVICPPSASAILPHLTLPGPLECGELSTPEDGAVRSHFLFSN